MLSAARRKQQQHWAVERWRLVPQEDASQAAGALPTQAPVRNSPTLIRKLRVNYIHQPEPQCGLRTADAGSIPAEPPGLMPNVCSKLAEEE